MYSIAKLLSDEPKRLESIILAVLKLLATIWIAQLFLGFTPDLSNFSIESFFRNIEIDESIYFVLTSIGVWYLVWEMLVELIVDFGIGLLSKIGNDEETLEGYLRWTYSVKTKRSKSGGKRIIIDSRPNLLHFTEVMQDEDEDYPFVIETRANQIFSVGLVCFIVLLNSEINLAGWQIGLGIFLLVNFLFVSIIQRKLHNYYFENPEFIRSKYYPLGQVQKVKNVISQIDPLKENYEIEVNRKKIQLLSKSPVDYLPSKITIVPVFLQNKSLGNKLFAESESKMIEKMKENELSVICSNFFNSDSCLTRIKDDVFSIHGDSQSELFMGFEELLYEKKKNYYSNLSKEEPPKQLDHK